MVQAEKYCVDIITQSSAIKEALSGVEHIILENHLSTHTSLNKMKEGKERKAIEEILKLYKLAQKKKMNMKNIYSLGAIVLVSCFYCGFWKRK